MYMYIPFIFPLYGILVTIFNTTIFILGWEDYTYCIIAKIMLIDNFKYLPACDACKSWKQERQCSKQNVYVQ